MPIKGARTPGLGDRGAAALEYAAVFVLVAGLAGVVLYAAPSLGDTIAQEVSRSICLAFGDRPDDCAAEMESADAPGDAPDTGPGAGGDVRPLDDLDGEFPVIGDGRAPGEYQVGSFNMGGGKEQAYEDVDLEEMTQSLVRSIEDRQPAVMAIQEACDAAIDGVEAATEEYSTVFNQVKKHDPFPMENHYSGADCKNDKGEFGTALIVHDDLDFDTDNEEHYDLTPEDGEFANLERRQMVCVTSETYQLAACTAHLTQGAPGEDDDGYDEEEADLLDRSRQAEAEEIQRILAEDYADYTVILGADLNAEPNSPETDLLYNEDYGGGAQGELIDASGACGDALADGVDCRDGEGTLPGSGRKIDYLFVSDDVQILDTHVGDANYSDHDLVWSDIHLDP